MQRELICIGCPMGCLLTVDYDKEKVLRVSGNTCSGGEKYAKDEIIHPRRTLTTTVRLGNSDEMLSVKSSAPLPKEKLLEYMKIINGIKWNAPVKVGDIIIENIGNTGADIVATKNIKGA